MNKIIKLFEEEFVLELLRREVLPLYPAFKDITRVEVKPYKKMIWETTYHVVVGYRVYFLGPDGQEQKIPIVCSAHSSEPRENIYRVLKYLQDRNFSNPRFVLPRPLFYSPEFRGTFYRALSGENLLYYIKHDERALVREQVALAAGLLARLHSLPAGPEADFNPINSRIATVIPGVAEIFHEMRQRYGAIQEQEFRDIYERFIAQEEKYLGALPRLALIHGDAHPENFIITKPEQIGLIDFTDFCLGDPARDLGTFLQQLDYKVIKKVGDNHFAAELRQLFLDHYLAATQQALTPDLQARIDLYYNWTAIRTSVYWFLKFGHNERRGAELLQAVQENLNKSS